MLFALLVLVGIPYHDGPRDFGMNDVELQRSVDVSLGLGS